MTKICRISPVSTHSWQVEVDDTCVSVRATRDEAIEIALRIVDAYTQVGVPCEAVLSSDSRPVRIAA